MPAIMDAGTDFRDKLRQDRYSLVNKLDDRTKCAGYNNYNNYDVKVIIIIIFLCYITIIINTYKNV